MSSRLDSSGLSVISEEKSPVRRHHDASGDHEGGHHSKIRSAYGGGHKKKHPLVAGSGRQGKLSIYSASKNNLSEFTQRIMSAKLIRHKQVQNQLAETQQQLTELMNENKILRNMQKRQEGALRRYEGNHAELPQLIRSHNEEIRTLKASNKLIKAQLKESNTKLKERESELEALRENYAKLKKLSTEKNLLEREKLQKKVDDLQEIIKEQEEKIQVLSRKILLESKNYRHHLNVEVLKHKETQKDLNNALTFINKLESQMAKEKSVPGGGKSLLKRDSKTVMPIINNKSIDLQPKVGMSEDSFLDREDRHRKSQISDSTNSELELLNNIMGSSDDTPSPTQDIFPEITRPKKSNVEKERITERSYSKSEVYEFNYEGGKKGTGSGSGSGPALRKPTAAKRSLRHCADVETNAKAIAEKITEDMDTLDDLVQKVESGSCGEDKAQLDLLYEEVKGTAAGKLDVDGSGKLSMKSGRSSHRDRESEKGDVKTYEREGRRNMSKRKLEESQKKQASQPEIDFAEDLSEVDPQKYASMSRTWNDLKEKIQEERKKAEEKMKELSKMNGLPNVSNSASSDSEGEKLESGLANDPVDLNLDGRKELRFVNFTDDAYILQELEKTDKVFNRLKNESKKAQQKGGSSSGTSSALGVTSNPSSTTTSASLTDKKSKSSLPTPTPKPRQVDIKSFRTESRRDPKFLEEFQSEYQKQNLIKALKAIDDAKDPSYSSEESGESEPETKTHHRFPMRSGLKGLSGKGPVSTDSKGSKELLTELFGTKKRLTGKGEMKFDFGTVAEVNE